MTLDEFFTTLDQLGADVPIDRLVELLKQLDVGRDELAPFLAFDDDHYQRNLVKIGEGYGALVLCWKPGQASPIHNHRGSACGVRVIRGEASETCYRCRPDGTLERQTRRYPAGHVCGSYDEAMHTMFNADPTEGLVTLHVYTPPLQEIQMYHEDGRVETWSDELTLAAQRAQTALAGRD